MTTVRDQLEAHVSHGVLQIESFAAAHGVRLNGRAGKELRATKRALKDGQIGFAAERLQAAADQVQQRIERSNNQ